MLECDTAPSLLQKALAAKANHAETLELKLGVRGWPQTLNNTLKGVKKDSEDILAHLERDMMEKRTAVTTLGQKVNALSTELEATNLRIAELEKVSVLRFAFVTSVPTRGVNGRVFVVGETVGVRPLAR